MPDDLAKWRLRKEGLILHLNLPTQVFHFLFIGNGYLRKGLSQLLHGLSLLKTRDFHLSVVGKDNKMEEYIEKAASYGLKNHVRFFGPRSDMRPFYQLADALAIPSFYDPFANVTVEALAMGLFVVSSRYNGGHEILTEQNGLILEDLLHPDALSQALCHALKHPKTLASAKERRESVCHLDFSKQLSQLTEACFE